MYPAGRDRNHRRTVEAVAWKVITSLTMAKDRPAPFESSSMIDRGGTTTVAKIIATEIVMDLGRAEDEDVAVVSTIHGHQHRGSTVGRTVSTMSHRGNPIGLVDHSNYLNNRMEDGRETLEREVEEEEEEDDSVTTVVRVRGRQSKSAAKLR